MDFPRPLLSVIVPVLDEIDQISSVIAHVRERLPEAELVVVDGRSRDGTWERVSTLPVDHALQAGPGRGVQLHAGAQIATGEVLLFLHADTRLPTSAATEIPRCLTDPQVVAGAFRTWHIPDGPASPLMRRLLHLADLRSRITALPYGDQALFVRRAAYEKAGGFPPYPIMEDLELSRRLRRLGAIARARARARVEVSGRRFQEGPLRYTLMVNLFPWAFRMGISPETLARFYRNVRSRGPR